MQIIKYKKRNQASLEINQKEIDENEKTQQNEGEIDYKKQLIESQEGKKGFRTIVSNRVSGQGITRTVNIGTITKEIGNAIITTKTTQISYKRKRVENINEQQ